MFTSASVNSETESHESLSSMTDQNLKSLPIQAEFPLKVTMDLVLGGLSNVKRVIRFIVSLQRVSNWPSPLFLGLPSSLDGLAINTILGVVFMGLLLFKCVPCLCYKRFSFSLWLLNLLKKLPMIYEINNHPMAGNISLI